MTELEKEVHDEMAQWIYEVEEQEAENMREELLHANTHSIYYSIKEGE